MSSKVNLTCTLQDPPGTPSRGQNEFTLARRGQIPSWCSVIVKLGRIEIVDYYSVFALQNFRNAARHVKVPIKSRLFSVCHMSTQLNAVLMKDDPMRT